MKDFLEKTKLILLPFGSKPYFITFGFMLPNVCGLALTFVTLLTTGSIK